MPKNDARCRWAKGALPEAYHDTEWGVPEHDDAKLYELLLPEGFQAGLSWYVVLSKREAFRKAFAGFDARRVAAFDERDVERMMADAGLIRCRRKPEAAIGNTRVFLAIAREFGSFDRYLWAWTDGKPVVATADDIPATTPLSDALSKELRKRGMKYMGSVTVYSFLQACGVVNDHERGCRCRKQA